jgi:hypothetical protein
MFVISECFPSVVHLFPLGSGDVHQLDYCSFLHVLCLLVLVYEAGESFAENSVDEIAESFFEAVGFSIPFVVSFSLRDTFYFLQGLFYASCFC